MNVKRKKIGLLIYANPDHYPPTVNAIYLLAEYFDIVLIGRNQDIPDREYPPNVEIHRLGYFSSLQERVEASTAKKLQEFTQFVLDARRFLQDVSIVYAYDSFAYVAACLCRLFLNHSVPIIYQSHEIGEYRSSQLSLTYWIEKAERTWIDQAEIVVFPDQDRADFYQKRSPLSHQPMIIPNFPLRSLFDLPSDWAAIVPQRWQKRKLFYRGTISQTSSMREMITAGSQIEKAEIQFVGFLNSNLQNQLNEWVDHHLLSARFSYLGRLPYADLTAHTLSATLGFALYKATSFDRVACATACNKIYEYAACGLPVIVSDFPTYRSYLKHEPWVQFADPNEPESIKSAIQVILSNFENYQQMCLAARQAFEEKFNYERIFYPLLLRIKALVDQS